jgi:hypothetical protein
LELKFFKENGAQDKTRTCTSLRSLPPQSSVSTNFTTWACFFLSIERTNIDFQMWGKGKKSFYSHVIFLVFFGRIRARIFNKGNERYFPMGYQTITGKNSLGLQSKNYHYYGRTQQSGYLKTGIGNDHFGS